MTNAPVEHRTTANADTPAKIVKPAEQERLVKEQDRLVKETVKSNVDSFARIGEAAKTSAKAGADALEDSGDAAVSGYSDLMSAYQAIAAKNTERLSALIHAFGAVKTPVEFIELQRKVMSEAITSAVADMQEITKLTTATFMAALAPIQKQIETAQRTQARAIL
jgi:hypothetical protein